MAREAMRYQIPYEVPARTAYEAISKATDLLRTNVFVRRVVSVGPTVPGWYEVKFEVEEMDMPEGADPMSLSKAWADR